MNHAGSPAIDQEIFDAALDRLVGAAAGSAAVEADLAYSCGGVADHIQELLEPLAAKQR